MTDNESGGGVKKSQVRLIGLGVGVVLVVAFIAGMVGSNPVQVSPTTTTTLFVPQTTSVPPEAAVQVPPLDCWELLSPDEMFSALGADEDPTIVNGASGFSKAEVCRQTLQRGENYFVEISPGGPSDFVADNQLLGVDGQEVADVADNALWFGGADSEGSGEYGVLVVNQESLYGRVYARIFLGRPDLDPDAQLEVAVGLAALALPRFPGVELEPPPPVEPEIFVFSEDEPPDTSGLSLDAFLFAREAEGEWTFEEGLLAVLGLLADDGLTEDVLGGTEMVDRDGSIVMLLATRYLETGDDPVVKERIVELIDQLTFSDEELATIESHGTWPPLLVSAVPLFAPAPGDGCGETESLDQCVTLTLLPERAGVTGNYLLYVPLVEDTDWSPQHIQAVSDTILDSAAKFEPLGAMPADLRVFLLPGGSQTYSWTAGDECHIYIEEGEARSSLGTGVQFQQRIAQYMAHCFLASEFRDLAGTDPKSSWWFNALAVYLSGYVYPEANLEHLLLPHLLSDVELATTMENRSTLNWAFFEHAHGQIGVWGNLALIAGLSPGNDSVEDLSAQSDIEELLHQFGLRLTDADLEDLGPGKVPYDPRAWALPVITPVKASFSVPAFGVRRIHIKVADGLRACYSVRRSGESLWSIRQGAPGEAITWDEPPVLLHGEWTLVVTTVGADEDFDLTIDEVGSDITCEDEEESPTPTLGDCGLCPPSQYFRGE
jgi:hypothetical protein